MTKNQIAKQAKFELSRRSFWWYCRLMAPDFYKPGRAYLRDLCDTLQEFVESGDRALIVNMPPRHGKSRTATCFVEWLLGRDPTLKIITGSYNEMLSTTFSRTVRNTIAAESGDGSVVYSDVFPNTTIRRGDSSAQRWSVNGAHATYLATSPGGTVTGFGCDIMIIDDLVKNAYEANNETSLESQWEWFTNTMLSRIEEGGKIIIVMTRWATRDLAGRLMAFYDDSGIPYRHITYKALQDDGSMLCDDILSRESYESKVALMGEDIASANYQQIPIDIKGVLYSSLKTYEEAPEFEGVYAYIDTADTGADYLCSIIYGVKGGEAYVLDVLYTREAMEITEPDTARRLFEFNVNVAYIESNNGGRGFARSVERILRQEHKTNKVIVRPFHQGRNKEARILSNATWVMEHIYFPATWKTKWREYYNAMVSYQRAGKNAHDDAPDATTGICERIAHSNIFSFE